MAAHGPLGQFLQGRAGSGVERADGVWGGLGSGAAGKFKVGCAVYASNAENPSMRRTFVITIITTVTLLGCASSPPQLQELPVPPQKINQPGYSFLPLNEKGWFAGPRNQYQVALVKRGNQTDETFAIQGIASKLPEFVSTDDFVQLVKQGQAADTDPKRFKIVEHMVVADSSKRAQCARSHLVTEDTGAVKRTSTVGPMILEVAALVCAHPGNRILGISIIYSHRYYPGQADPAFMQKADQVINSIEFTALGEGSN